MGGELGAAWSSAIADGRGLQVMTDDGWFCEGRSCAWLPPPKRFPSLAPSWLDVHRESVTRDQGPVIRHS